MGVRRVVRGFKNCEEFCKGRMKQLKEIFKRGKVEYSVEFLRDIIKDEVLEHKITSVISGEEMKDIDKILSEVS